LPRGLDCLSLALSRCSRALQLAPLEAWHWQQELPPARQVAGSFCLPVRQAVALPGASQLLSGLGHPLAAQLLQLAMRVLAACSETRFRRPEASCVS
jgi:hypothetical protein